MRDMNWLKVVWVVLFNIFLVQLVIMFLGGIRVYSLETHPSIHFNEGAGTFEILAKDNGLDEIIYVLESFKQMSQFLPGCMLSTLWRFVANTDLAELKKAVLAN
jgi:hypothetical protein